MGGGKHPSSWAKSKRHMTGQWTKPIVEKACYKRKKYYLPMGSKKNQKHENENLSQSWVNLQRKPGMFK